MKKISIVVIVFLFMASFIFAADRGTPKEAQAMVKKAVAFLKESGKDKAFAEFSNPKGKFVNKDLYIWVLDAKKNGLVYVHEANPKLVGQEMIDLKDADGKPFIKEIVSGAASKGSGWVDYKWTHPVSKKVEAKTTYFEKVGDFIILCGAYK
ncbi:MAG: cache domain-containing protein [Syntrophales bacterium]|jgi:cytochrome c